MLMFIIGNAICSRSCSRRSKCRRRRPQWITDLGLPPWGVPDRAEPAAARRGLLHGSDVGRADLRADHVPDRDALGIHPVHLGIIMTVNMEIGMVTPPVGLNLFVTSGIAELPVTRVMRAALPWLVVLLAVLDRS